MDDWQDAGQADRLTVRLDYSNMMSDFVGEAHGISAGEIEALVPRAREIAADITGQIDSGELGFYQLPYDTAVAEAVLKLSESLRPDCEDLVISGIGGSALGITALLKALCHPLHNLLSREERGGLPRVFVLDNVDPVSFKGVLDVIRPEKAIFNVITKSGSTAETLAQFLIIRQMLIDRLGPEEAARRIVVTTGPEKRNLNELAAEEGYPVLTIPDNVGGRFSVLTPVGLFPAAMFGVDIAGLLAGARHMDGRCRAADLYLNPAYLAGTLYYIANVKKQSNVAVMMPYSDSLIQMAFWFRQLWAESLGKAVDTAGKTVNVGQTPVVAAGVTDQHSQLQLYQEGPYDKVITFLSVGDRGASVPIPRISGQRESLTYLGGHDMAELIRIEEESTRIALTKAGRLNMSFLLPEVNAFTIGQLFFLLEVQTVFTGGLYNVNPLDQPGVEASKQFIYGMMGRPRFEDKAAESRAWLERQSSYII